MFSLQEIRELPLYRCVGRRYVHDCGLQVVSLEADDAENMFAVCLPTPPVDDTGVTHIIEHTVLAGSRRYPVKDPFLELNKSSMATFLNALTYQDHTVYPVSTAVPAEFFSLADVYFDAVFAPLLEKEKFLQEGWRYSIAGRGPRSRLGVNGIVYNEMRGDYYDVDVTVAREMSRRMLRGNPRAFVSGGDPFAIPGLSYRAFLRYYAEHYHPSRALVFLYGNIPTEEKLAFLEARLSALPRREAPPPLSARRHPVVWSKPRRGKVAYVPSDGSGDSCAWARETLLSWRFDPFQDLTFEFLHTLLLGNGASPLRKRLLESGLFESLGISGYDNESPETSFLVTLNGVERRKLKAVERLVEGSLEALSKERFTKEQIAGVFSLFKVEEHAVTSEYVFSLMENVFDCWSYGLDPFCYLDRGAVWKRLENTLRDDGDFLNRTIRKSLLENRMTLTLELLPEPDLPKRDGERERERLERRRARMSPRALERVRKQNLDLRAHQGMPDAKEALESLPRLRMKEVPAAPILQKVTSLILPGGCDFRIVDDFSGEITYLSVALALPEIPGAMVWDYHTAMGVLPRVGTRALPYDKNSLRWDAAGASFTTAMKYGYMGNERNRPAGFWTIHFSALSEHFAEGLCYLREQLEDVVFQEKERIRSLWRQGWSVFQESLVNASRRFAVLRASAGVSDFCTLQEMGTGLGCKERLRRHVADFKADYSRLAESGEGIVRRVVRNGRAVAAGFLGSEANARAAMEFVSLFRGGDVPCVAMPFSAAMRLPSCGRREHFPVNSNVSAYARALHGPFLTDENAAALKVYANLLNNGCLWEEIRVKGGAYGAGCSMNVLSGLFSLYSSQDPAPQTTEQVLDSLPRRRTAWTEREVENAVIASLRSMHTPVRAASATSMALHHAMFQVGYEALQEWHDRLRRVTKADVESAAEAYWAGRPCGNDCILGPGRAR